MFFSKVAVVAFAALVSVQADPDWSQADQDALAELLAKQDAARARRAPSTPEIRTDGGDVTIIAGSDGKHIAFEIAGERVNIDQIPDEMRSYSNAAAQTLSVGYNMGKTTKSVSDTCEKLLTKLDAQVEKDITKLQDDVKGIETSVASTVSSLTSSVDTKIQATESKISDSVADTVAALKATVATQLESTTEYVNKAKACATAGQGVTVVGGKLTCSDVKPTADKDDKCDDKTAGKIKVVKETKGKYTTTVAYVCLDKYWQFLKRAISEEARLLGSSASKKAKSCKEIKAANPEAESKKYYVTQGNNQIYPVFCVMDDVYKGGGWQLLLTLTHPRKMFSGSQHPLGTSNINSGSPSLTSSYARNWNGVNKPVINDEFLLIGSAGQWMSAVMTHTHCGWSSRSTGVCTGCHGTYAKIQIYDPSGSKINCGGQGCWLNSCSVCGGCSSHGCDTIGFNADKSDYQNRGGGSNWRAYGSGWESPMEGYNCGGNWGRENVPSIFPLNLAWRPKA